MCRIAGELPAHQSASATSVWEKTQTLATAPAQRRGTNSPGADQGPLLL